MCGSDPSPLLVIFGVVPFVAVVCLLFFWGLSKVVKL